jgi:rod shape-determining protein MreD
MTSLLYIPISLLLIVVQTTILNNHPLLPGFHDLPLLLVTYMGLFRPMREGLLYVLVMGFVMDGLSEGPLGLYVTAYFWICFSISWLMTFLHVRSKLLLPFVFALATVLENCILLWGMIIGVPGARVPESIAADMVLPVVWIMVTGPLFCLGIDALSRKLLMMGSQQEKMADIIR